MSIESTDDLFPADVFNDELISQVKENPTIVIEKLQEILKEKLDLELSTLKDALSVAVANKAEELSLELPNIAPYDDYGAMMEDNDSMSTFLKTEAPKVENWILHSITDDQHNKNLIKFTFFNKAVDDGSVLLGLAFVSKNGKLRHAFATVDV